jgi:hypothetical protein
MAISGNVAEPQDRNTAAKTVSSWKEEFDEG